MRVDAVELEQRPPWLRFRPPAGESYDRVSVLMRARRLQTVCQELHCPNIAECWNQGTATFLMWGGARNRSGSTLVESERPTPFDLDEPSRIAGAAQSLHLRYAVLDGVNREELPDGGAFLFARTVDLVHRTSPETVVETSVPDFHGSFNALETVLSAEPDVLHHDIGTVPRLYARLRPGARYERSLILLRRSKELAPEIPVKSGLMLGQGETLAEIIAVMEDLHRAAVDVVVLGQFLRFTEAGLFAAPAGRLYLPAEFESLASLGKRMGFRHVEAEPLARSSYRAAEQLVEIRGSAQRTFAAQEGSLVATTKRGA